MKEFMPGVRIGKIPVSDPNDARGETWCFGPIKARPCRPWFVGGRRGPSRATSTGELIRRRTPNGCLSPSGRFGSPSGTRRLATRKTMSQKRGR